MGARQAISILAIATSACASSPVDRGASDDVLASDAGAASSDGPPSAPAGRCNAITQMRAIEGFQHIPVCLPFPYGTKPPSSGNHYPIWSAYETYSSPVPEGFWVHNLEHGAIVLSYDCPGGCDADVAAAKQWIDALPPDPACGANRVLMTPDPNLDVPFAASAWGWTLRADCFDAAAFQAFFDAHYGRGREGICGGGDDLSSGLAPDCGDADYSP
jgi:hypothetical protein